MCIYGCTFQLPTLTYFQRNPYFLWQHPLLKEKTPSKHVYLVSYWSQWMGLNEFCLSGKNPTTVKTRKFKSPRCVYKNRKFIEKNYFDISSELKEMIWRRCLLAMIFILISICMSCIMFNTQSSKWIALLDNVQLILGKNVPI